MCNEEHRLLESNIYIIKYGVDNDDVNKYLKTLYRYLWTDDNVFVSTLGHAPGKGLSLGELKRMESSLSRSKKSMPTLSQYLNELMYEKEMTQSSIAKRSGLTYNYVNNLVNGVSKGTKYKLIAIAIAMRLSLEETAKLLDTCGYKLNDSLKDKIIIVSFNEDVWDVSKVEDALNRVHNAGMSLFKA
ncbi:helix-turn-helix domain-containing protein [Alkalibacillus salilacus]|uniref:Transcriptional regulator with XRE-family HTH domain n=1 Tax=Alkalibacillus salilacus TaxID=284582 RepID=A0ABT9VFV0_9BACI|nr:helix-turn-helix transcriptional regulator [Alkalibacillus salilacus]MDQ0159740.1 transcriptional regulator with XRE-family HTH domain [Alkalibacillus salilacus]